MSTTWIVVADSSRARIFSVDRSSAPLTEQETLDHPEARSQEHDLRSDRPGRSFDSAGEGRHAMADDTDPKEYEGIRFAQHLADRLEQARTHNQVNKLYLVAAPEFLGHLRARLSSATAALVAREVDKNLTKHDADDIRKHLPERL